MRCVCLNYSLGNGKDFGLARKGSMTLLINRPQDAFGPLLKSWRTRRRLSQLDLALYACMSQRHLSFLETGRSKPSRYAIRQICEALEMPAAEQDVMLMSAGFAPQSANASWSADVRDAVGASIDHVLKGHEPFPAVSIDRIWNLQRANESAQRFFCDCRRHRSIQSAARCVFARCVAGQHPQLARGHARPLPLARPGGRAQATR